jgi:2-iminobutanoate/2-iminopropanoate deaminase
VAGGISEQTKQALATLKAILAGAGSSLSKVVKTKVFLQDLGEFAAVNEVRARHFISSAPARATVEVVRLPNAARIEIDMIPLA